MAGRFLYITQEAAFGTYNGSGEAINPWLSGSNAFAYPVKPNFWEVMDGSGLNIPALSGTSTTGVSGSLTTELTYSQAEFLLGWGATRINSGQTAPWTTTELPNDLASCTCDFAYQPFDSATFKKPRFLGMKVSNMRLSGGTDSPKMMLNLGLVGGSQSTHTQTAPAYTAYPTDVVLFRHLSGGFEALGAARTNFDSISITWQNVMKPYFDESQYANAVRLGGRRITVETRFRLKSTGTDRTAYEAGTQGTLELVFTNGTNTITLDFKGKALINPLNEDFPLQEETYYSATMNILLDASASGDYSLTYA